LGWVGLGQAGPGALLGWVGMGWVGLGWVGSGVGQVGPGASLGRVGLGWVGSGAGYGQVGSGCVKVLVPARCCQGGRDPTINKRWKVERGSGGRQARREVWGGGLIVIIKN